MAEETDQQFQKRCSDIIGNGCTTLCLALGHKLKLFQHLNETPQSSERIANSAGLRERYVREWLKSMAVANLVDVDDKGEMFSIKDNKKTFLCSGSLVFATFVPLFAKVYEQIAECFKPDGPRGTPYSAYEGFHEIMTEDSDQNHHAKLINEFIPAVAGLVEKLNSGITCLDVGCGHGTPSYLLAKHFPKSTFYGLDFVKEAVDVAVTRAKADNLSNVRFFAYDAAQMPDDWKDKFDYITTFDSIHDQAYPDKVLGEIFRVLKPGGVYSMVDINAHTNVALNKEHSNDGVGFLYTASLFHCMPVSLYFEGGTGLGTAWGKEKAAEMLKAAGFVGSDFSLAGTSNFNYHCLSRKPINR